MGSSRDWRSPDFSKAVESLDRSEIAFEFLRRNSEYKKDYVSTLQRIAEDPTVEEEAMSRLSDRWGLSFPRKP